MAGLLDNNYRPDPLAQGLLGFGTALMTPRAQGGGMAAGMQAFGQGAQDAQMMRRRMELDALREELLRSQMDENKSQAAVREAQAKALLQKEQRAEAQRVGQAGILSDIASAQQPGFKDASIAITGNAPAGYQPPGQRNPITQEVAARWVATGGDIATLKQLAESGDWGRQEVARILERRGADGTPEQLREDKFGRQVGAAVPKPFEMRMQDIGGSVVPVNPYAPTALTKTMTPDGQASNALGWANNALTRRGQDLTDSRARETLAFQRNASALEAGPEQQALVARFGKAPANYRWALDGSGRSEPIPGGPADPTVKDPKQAQRAETSAKTADLVIDKIDSALKKVGWSTTGIVGAVAGKVPGSDAYDLRAEVETVKANIGFERLQQMREASPTGGALGQVAVQELMALQAVLGNLDPNQSPAQISKNLNDVRKHLDAWRNVMRQAANGQQGGGGAGQQSAAPAGANDLQEAARRELARRANPRGGASGSF
jgi:hypothetical protein